MPGDLIFVCFFFPQSGGGGDPASVAHCAGAQDAQLQVPLRLLSQAPGHQGPHPRAHQGQQLIRFVTFKSSSKTKFSAVDD